jgi:hypothetical protein
MKLAVQRKSSFTLPGPELKLVARLKTRLPAKSNTEVIRLALSELGKQLDRKALRDSFAQASKWVCAANAEDMKELDALAFEGLGED